MHVFAGQDEALGLGWGGFVHGCVRHVISSLQYAG